MTTIILTFNLNGGTGTFDPVTPKKKSNYKIPTTVPTKTGYTFSKWKDQLGKVYDKGVNYPVGTVNVTLTAQWTAIQYTVTYNKGTGTGTVPAQGKLTIGSKFLLKSPTQLKAPTGQSFIGWRDQSGITYQSGYEYTISSSNVTLTAQWAITFIVTFSAGTGTGSKQPITLASGSTLVMPDSSGLTAPSGKTFAGWSDGINTTRYQPGANYTLTSAVTFTAQWGYISVIIVGGNMVSNVVYLQGETVIFPDSSHWGNFRGWLVQGGQGDSLNTIGLPYSMPAHNIEFHAYLY